MSQGTLASVKPSGIVTVALLIAAAIGLGVMPAPPNVDGRVMPMLAILLLTVGLWATAPIPQYLTALGFFALCLAFDVAPLRAVTSGITSSALWLVAGGLMIGVAADRSGFGAYVAQRFFGVFRGSFAGLVGAVLLGSTVLSFLVPASMGRLAIVVPVVIALAKDAGYERGSRGFLALIMITVAGNFLVSQGVLPANLLNIMIVGSGEALYGLQVSYVQYLWLCAPVLMVVKAFIIWGATCWLFPAPVPALGARGEGATKPAMSAQAKTVAVILTAAIVLWSTDFLHGFAPGWVALAAGVACLTPGLKLLTWRDCLDERRVGMLIWVAAVLSLGAVLSSSGAGPLIAKQIIALAGVEGRSALYGYGAIALMTPILTSLCTTGGGIPIIASTVGEIAQLTGMPLETAILTIVAGQSVVFFPYTTAPIVFGLMLGGISTRDALRYMVPIALISLVTIVPLNALWWWWIGALP
ncbi:MAG: SLC13 family permease [Pseudomonadota bacterium]